MNDFCLRRLVQRSRDILNFEAVSNQAVTKGIDNKTSRGEKDSIASLSDAVSCNE